MSGASMPLADRRSLGAFGEQAASDHLVSKGYTIALRNWRCKLGELDLVVTLAEQIIFVEVRTRQGNAAPLESITPAKQRRLRALAYAYLSATAQLAAPWRIDVVGVSVGRDGRVARIEHLEYAVGE
jgi:putative endonuclease